MGFSCYGGSGFQAVVDSFRGVLGLDHVLLFTGVFRACVALWSYNDDLLQPCDAQLRVWLWSGLCSKGVFVYLPCVLVFLAYTAAFSLVVFLHD